MQHLYYRIQNYFKPHTYHKQTPKSTEEVFIPYAHPHTKPSWVKDKVMYLKVHLPHDGCRKIAISFNNQYAHKDISVSKSYVYRVIKENTYEILLRRKRMHQNLNYNTPANAWDNKPMSTSKNCTHITYYRGLCDNVAGFYFRE